MKIINSLIAVLFLLSISACILTSDGKGFQIINDNSPIGDTNNNNDDYTGKTEYDLCIEECAIACERQKAEDCTATCEKACSVFQVDTSSIKCEEPSVEKVCSYIYEKEYKALLAELDAKCPMEKDPAACYAAGAKMAEEKGLTKQTCIEEKVAGSCWIVRDPVCKDVYEDVLVDENKCISMKNEFTEKTAACQKAYDADMAKLNIDVKVKMDQVCALKIADPVKCDSLKKDYEGKLAYCNTLGDPVKIKDCIASADANFKEPIAAACKTFITDEASCIETTKAYNDKSAYYKSLYDLCANDVIKNVQPSIDVACAARLAEPERCAALKKDYTSNYAACKGIGDEAKIKECIISLDAKMLPDIDKACAKLQVLADTVCDDGLDPFNKDITTCEQKIENTCAYLYPEKCTEASAKFSTVVKEKCGEKPASYDVKYEECYVAVKRDLVEPACVQSCNKVTKDVYSTIKEQIAAFSKEEAQKAFLEALKAEPVCKIADVISK